MEKESAQRAGAALTVCLSFDFDGPSGWLADDSRSIADVSRGEFAAVAVPRILDLLDKHGVSATFFVPGHTALAYPRHVEDILGRGHEVGHHGWVHETPGTFDLDRQREFFARGIDALERVAGIRPVGYRAPGIGYTPETIQVLAENGIAYDSGLSASDFQPYYLRQGDLLSATEPYLFGTTTGIVELPFAWALDDWVHFEYYAGQAMTLNAPSAVREVWQAEFDYAWEKEPGGVFILCMHPEVIGRGSRIMMLDSLIEHMASRPGVRFEKMADFATRWRSANTVDAWLASSSPLVPRPFPLQDSPRSEATAGKNAIR